MAWGVRFSPCSATKETSFSMGNSNIHSIRQSEFHNEPPPLAGSPFLMHHLPPPILWRTVIIHNFGSDINKPESCYRSSRKSECLCGFLRHKLNRTLWTRASPRRIQRMGSKCTHHSWQKRFGYSGEHAISWRGVVTGSDQPVDPPRSPQWKKSQVNGQPTDRLVPVITVKSAIAVDTD